MKLEEAYIKLNKITNQPFVNLFQKEELENIKVIVNKGGVGQLIETLLGLPHTNHNIDFEDGELKTNKCDSNGKPLETIAIRQINSNNFDELVSYQPFEKSLLYQKIKNILYVPICKEGNIMNWKILQCTQIDIRNEEYKELRNTLRKDYDDICKALVCVLDEGSQIHHINGKYLQIRSKDYKDKKTHEYHPIYSEKYKRQVSNKGYAFYFQKNFVNEVIRKNVEF